MCLPLSYNFEASRLRAVFLSAARNGREKKRRSGFAAAASYFRKAPCQSRAFSVRMEQRKGGRSAWRPLCTLTLSYPPEKAEGSISCRAHPRRGEALTRFRAYFFIFCPCPGGATFFKDVLFCYSQGKVSNMTSSVLSRQRWPLRLSSRFTRWSTGSWSPSA